MLVSLPALLCVIATWVAHCMDPIKMLGPVVDQLDDWCPRPHVASRGNWTQLPMRQALAKARNVSFDTKLASATLVQDDFANGCLHTCLYATTHDVPWHGCACHSPEGRLDTCFGLFDQVACGSPVSKGYQQCLKRDAAPLPIGIAIQVEDILARPALTTGYRRYKNVSDKNRSVPFFGTEYISTYSEEVYLLSGRSGNPSTENNYVDLCFRALEVFVDHATKLQSATEPIMAFVLHPAVSSPAPLGWWWACSICLLLAALVGALVVKVAHLLHTAWWRRPKKVDVPAAAAAAVAVVAKSPPSTPPLSWWRCAVRSVWSIGCTATTDNAAVVTKLPVSPLPPALEPMDTVSTVPTVPTATPTGDEIEKMIERAYGKDKVKFPQVYGIVRSMTDDGKTFNDACAIYRLRPPTGV